MLNDIIVLVVNLILRIFGARKRTRDSVIGWIEKNLSCKKWIVKIPDGIWDKEKEPYKTIRPYIELTLDVIGYILFIVCCAWLYIVIKYYQTDNVPSDMKAKNCQIQHAIIKNPVRHYYPVIEGEELRIMCEIHNHDSEKSLSIIEAQPSDFSTYLTSDMPIVIDKNDSAYVSFVFYTDKNIGNTTHIIRFYTEGRRLIDSLVFDTHVVRPSHDHSDYEEHYAENKKPLIEELVDGKPWQHGYWTDDVNYQEATAEDSAYIVENLERKYGENYKDSVAGYSASPQKEWNGPEFHAKKGLWTMITDMFDPLFNSWAIRVFSFIIGALILGLIYKVLRQFYKWLFKRKDDSDS